MGGPNRRKSVRIRADSFVGTALKPESACESAPLMLIAASAPKPGGRLYEGLGMKVREAIKLVESNGWRLVRTRRSHRHFHHPSKPGIVTIAGHPSQDLDPKTQASILKQAGLKK